MILVLLLCINAISGCGAPSTPATTIPPVPPQPTIITHPFRTTVQTFDRDFTIALAISPDHSGTNVFTANVTDNRTNRPAAHVAIILYTTMLDMAMGTNSIVLRADGEGRFDATSDVVNMDGHWAIGITIQTSDQVIHKAGVSFIAG